MKTHSRSRGAEVVALLLAVAVTLLAACGSAAQIPASRAEQSTFRPQAEATGAPDAPASPLQTGETFFDAAFFNIMVPGGWQVTETTGGRTLLLESSSGDAAHNIEITFLDEEIGQQNTLEAWYPAARAKAGTPIAEVNVFKSTQRYDSAGDNTRMLVLAAQSAAGPEQIALRTNFNLVLSIRSSGGGESVRKSVAALAESLGFHNDAPRNLLDLEQRAGAQAEPVNLSSLTLQRWGYMESWPRYEVTVPLWEWWYGGDALLHRTIPNCQINFRESGGGHGGPPDPNPPYVRRLDFAYRELGSAQERYVSFTFGASAPATPATDGEMSCLRAVDALLDTVHLAPSGMKPSTLPVLAQNGPADAVVPLAAGGVTERANPDDATKVILNASGSYAPEPRFEVSIAAAEWTREGSMLTHATIAGCSLNIAEGGHGMSSPGTDGSAELPRSQWFVRDFPAEQYVTYTLTGLAGVPAGALPQQTAYLFGLRYPALNSAQVRACRAAAEAVLATFVFAGE